MPLFWFHDSQGLPLVIWSGTRAGMRGSMGTLSRRFSASMLHVLWEKGDFSIPLRFGRNDERSARRHRHLERSRMPLWGQMENALMIL